MNRTASDPGIYASPASPLAAEPLAGDLISPQAAADFSTAVLWMKRAGWALIALVAVHSMTTLVLGWEWTDYSWSRLIGAIIGTALTIAGLLYALMELRRSVRVADQPGDFDATLVQSLRHQRNLWKRAVLAVLVLLGLLVIFMLTGAAVLR